MTFTLDEMIKKNGLPVLAPQNQQGGSSQGAPGTQTLNQILDKSYPGKTAQPTPPPPKTLDQVMNIVNKAYGVYSNIGAPVGAVVGAAAAPIGFAAGASGEGAIQSYNLLKGKGYDAKKIYESGAENAKKTAKFGYDVGKAGGAAAPLADAPLAVNALLTATQGYGGYENLSQGIKEKDPEKITQGITELGTALIAAFGLGKQGISAAKTRSIEPVYKPARTTMDVIDLVKKKFETSKNTKILNETVDLVREPLETRTDISSALKQSRGSTTGITKERIIAPSPRDLKLAEDVKDVIKGSDKLKNIENLSTALDSTEKKLDGLLGADKTPIVKQSVFDTLDELKQQIPEGFKSDVTQQNIYERVVNYAKTVASKQEPTVKGLRRARTLFDQEARKQFPQAYKDGFIDTSTPAGNAIKSTRQAMNDYLYNTARDGSDIQALIGKESSYLQSIDNIAWKATKEHGKNAIKLWIKNNPLAAKAIGIGVSTAFGGGIVREILK